MTKVDNEEEYRQKWTYREEYYKGILTEQFQLAYFGRVDYYASSLMPVSERKYLYELLVEQKRSEREAQDKAVANRDKNGSGKSRGGRKRKR